MSRRTIDRRTKTSKKSSPTVDILAAARAQQKMRKNRERAMDDEAIRRYIYNKEFDMEFRYDSKYRAEWARKANMSQSRFGAALDRVIKEAWRNIRDGKVDNPGNAGEGEPGKTE